MKINDEFIDNFDNIYRSELKPMKSKLIKNSIKFNDDQEVIKIFNAIKNMTKRQIEEWKESEFDPNYDDNDATCEYFQAGMLLLSYDINPNNLKKFFNKISYHGRIFLAYKLLLL